MAELGIYIHDVQDYYLHDQQMAIFNWHLDRGIPINLVIIAGSFGEDEPLVEKTRQGIGPGLFQVISHSFSHVDLTQLTKEEIREDIEKAQNRIKEVLGVEPTLYIPPYFLYNRDILDVLEELGLTPKLWEPYLIWYPEWTDQGWVALPPEVIIDRVYQFYKAYGKAELHVHPTETFDINLYTQIIETSLAGAKVPTASIVNFGIALGVTALAVALVASLVKGLK